MTSGGTKYYHFNDLGSTVLVTNGSGSANNALAYSAWGEVLAGTQKPYNYVGEYGYYSHTSGQVLDELRQLGVRYYDAETGRFTQRDPIILAESMYSYSGNKSLTAIDPSGYDFKDYISPEGKICISARCHGNENFGGAVGIPDLGSDIGQRGLFPLEPRRVKKGQGNGIWCTEYPDNCMGVDAVDFPADMNMNYDGVPQRPSSGSRLKIPNGARCNVTCNHSEPTSTPTLECSMPTFWRWFSDPPRWIAQ